MVVPEVCRTAWAKLVVKLPRSNGIGALCVVRLKRSPEMEKFLFVTTWLVRLRNESRWLRSGKASSASDIGMSVSSGL